MWRPEGPGRVSFYQFTHHLFNGVIRAARQNCVRSDFRQAAEGFCSAAGAAVASRVRLKFEILLPTKKKTCKLQSKKKRDAAFHALDGVVKFKRDSRKDIINL